MAFVGRAQELGELVAVLDAADAGRGRLVLIAGEPGTGKTRLVEELAGVAAERGIDVVWARCAGGEGAPALWPWVEALRSLAELGRLADPDLPGLLVEGERAPGLLGEVDPAGARFRLFDRVATSLRRATGAVPLALVLDDLHYADRTSLRLLEHVTSTLHASRILVLATFRDTEMGDALVELLGRLSSDTERLTLRGVDLEGVRALASAALDAPVDDSLAAALLERTGGNPLFVREVVRLLASQGFHPVNAVPSRVPDSIREVLDRRLARLSSACVDVLAVAAIIGREFDSALLIDALDGTDVGGQLDEAVAARVVVERGWGRYAFAHDLFRQALDEGLALAHRQGLHLAVGQAIAAGRDADHASRRAELAHHYLAAGPLADPSTSVGYARQAGELAARQLAFDEATQHYTRALAAAIDVLPSECGPLLLSLGDARWRAQDVVGARQEFLEASRLARAADHAETFARAALGFGCGLGGNQPLAAADPELMELLDEALTLLPGDDGELRCRLLGRLAVELYLTDDLARRTALSAEAVAMARRLDDPRALAAALYARQIAVFGPDGFDERQQAADEILALAEQAGDPELALWGNLFRVWARAERCLPVDHDLAVCARIADRLGLPGYQAEVALRQAVIAIVAGDFDEVDRLLQVVDSGAVHDLAAGSSQVALLALTALLRGPLDQLEPIVASLLIEFPEKRMWWAALAVLYAEQGRVDEARREFDALADRGFDIARDGLWLNGMIFLAFVSFVLGDAERADTLHGMVMPHVDQAPVGAFGSMASAVGLIDAARRRYDDALHWLQIGHDRDVAMGNLAFAAWTRRESAAVLLARDGPGDRSEARQRLEGLVADLRQSGFDGFVPRAEALLATAKAPGSHDSGELRRDGAGWELAFAGTSARVPSSKGVDDLATLLARPGRDIAAVDLAGAVTSTDTGEALDARARTELRSRLAELEEDLAEADEFGDAARAAKARSERDSIVEHLTSATGLGGRARRTGDARERARKAVTWRIRKAIAAIAEVHPVLGRHLDVSVRTGAFCSYRPDPVVTWHIHRDR